ncbi:MAG: DNA-binding protein H-NS [Glomeribacter sp. 1016415]|nr:H-NS histone family protein [Mycoavidus cysteinexigens]MCX8566237.1 DNA-binding protein H-NS [Glomeribacter sp. 1016415]GAM53290.1 DNA-binding protein H-NS [bacterium endosymbiont of Mortierella elongata FMR23-6]
MSSYEELLAQQAKLEKQIEEAKAKECAAVIDEIKKKIAIFGITLDELGLSKKELNLRKSHMNKQRARTPVAPKYRDPQTGVTWSGRGKPPKWIVGKDRGSYLI